MKISFNLLTPVARLFEGAYVTDKDNTILLFNRAAESISGFSSDEMIGSLCEELIKHIDSSGKVLCKTSLCPLRAALGGEDYSATLFLSHRAGYRVPIEVRSVRTEGRGYPLLFQFFRIEKDTRYLENLVKRLTEEAILDPLTKLYNRRQTEKILATRLGELKRYSAPAGLLFMDIDNFKYINDTFGHPAGDGLLKNISKTLVHNSRSVDTLSRWGGEEFLVILPGADTDSAQITAEKYRTLIKHTYTKLKGKKIGSSVSIGCTLLRKDDSLQTAVERADSLMYRSKTEGKDRITFGT